MTHIEREQCLVASILDNPTAKWGECVSTAMAFAPHYWESPEAAPIAAMIVELSVGRAFVLKPSRAMVAANLQLKGGDVHKWIKHPSFNDGLPWSCTESLAEPLLAHYRNKQIIGTLGDAYSKLIDKPEQALEVARKLKETLSSWV